MVFFYIKCQKDGEKQAKSRAGASVCASFYTILYMHARARAWRGMYRTTVRYVPEHGVVHVVT